MPEIDLTAADPKAVANLLKAANGSAAALAGLKGGRPPADPFAEADAERMAEEILTVTPGLGGDGLWPAGWHERADVQAAHRLLARRFVAALPAEPPRDWEQDGIVIAGGGRYWAGTYVLVRLLRRLGCRLPVEVWYFGHADELDAGRRAMLEAWNVRCVDADSIHHVHPRRCWGGWQMKPFAVYHSPFRRVLYLDADCYPAEDPTPWFDDADFRQRGAWFFPDCAAERLPPRTWEIFGLPYVDEPAFESGQFFVDKSVVWRELLLAQHFNDHSDFYYRWRGNKDPLRIIYGDKDTFHFAWWMLGRWYAMQARQPDVDGPTESYLHRDKAGRLLFVHRCRNKFRLPGDQFGTRQNAQETLFRGHLPHEEALHGFLAELAAGTAGGPLAAQEKPPTEIISAIGRNYSSLTLCVPTLNRYDLLPRLIAAARAGTRPPDHVVVMDNGGGCPDLAGVEVVRPGWNVGVAASWNWFLRNAPGLAVIANDDATPAPDALERLERAAEADPAGLVFVGRDAGLWRWALFLQRRESLGLVGPYDEEFWPAYYEDNDYEIRLRLAGRPVRSVEGVAFGHDASSSAARLSDADRLTHNHFYQHGKAYYVQKWGGEPRAERFAAPFGRPQDAWLIVPGAFSFEALYRRAVAEARPGGLLVEVGVWKGRSLAFLAAEAKRAGKGLRASGVDHFRGDGDPRTRLLAFDGGGCYVSHAAAYLARAGVLPDVRLVVADSLAAADLFPDYGVDFVMLDGAHDAAGLAADLKAWWAKVRPGGLLAGHDYTNPAWPDVRPTADAFFGSEPGGLDSGLGDGCFVRRRPGGEP